MYKQFYRKTLSVSILINETVSKVSLRYYIKKSEWINKTIIQTLGYNLDERFDWLVLGLQLSVDN